MRPVRASSHGRGAAIGNTLRAPPIAAAYAQVRSKQGLPHAAPDNAARDANDNISKDIARLTAVHDA